ncbi:MAG: DUF5107 domain-containing protein [Anaerolineae bacterium]
MDVQPRGARVFVDGTVQGEAPLTLLLPPGQHRVAVEKEGYDTFQEVIELDRGQRLTLSVHLVDIAPPVVSIIEPGIGTEPPGQIQIKATATDNKAVTALALAIDGTLVYDVAADSLTYHWETGPGAYLLQIEARDAAGNVGQAELIVNVVEASGQASPQPSPPAISTPSPAPTSVPEAPSALTTVEVRQETITLSVYPYQAYLDEAHDARYGMTYPRLDRQAYDASHPTPGPKAFKAVILENRYLELTVLPELGGRLYQALFKPTGQSVFYNNVVVKPSRWGPAGDNWWLAAGGMEWAFPVREHGYQWGVPWQYSIEGTSEGATVTLWDSQADHRLQAGIAITLERDKGYFTVEPRLENPTDQPLSFQFWLNAMLTLGSRTISPHTEFILPADRVVVHSSGDPELPAGGESIPWPLYKGRDLSRYSNWRNWIGLFVQQPTANFAAAYNHDTGLGIARIFPVERVPGVKLFAFGPEFGDRAHYTDDGSQYFELWGGLPRTFWPEDDFTLAANSSVEWQERWYPFWGIEGLDFASQVAALNLSVEKGTVFVGVAAPLSHRGTVVLLWEGQELWRTKAVLGPESPFRESISLPGGGSKTGELSILVLGEDGTTLAEYREEVTLP